ncbi:probable serine-O-acetyltransferase [Acanthaster planci]|uniref:Probable serine-O-acetyltransferase n=1 Tax=Acanthaster planci TaxID=133434 RepID=A0A8B7YNR3_ACAPL|nr:probable serine-O-acetyltransferase [Acanthaster planci]
MTSQTVAALRRLVHRSLGTVQALNTDGPLLDFSPSQLGMRKVHSVSCTHAGASTHQSMATFKCTQMPQLQLNRPLSHSSRWCQQEEAQASGKQTTEPVTGKADSSPASSAASHPLPQLEVPDYDKELLFKGLETDFPCLSRLPPAGPEPEYHKISSGYKVFHSQEPFHMKYGGVLPELHIAYETWGELNQDRSNVVILNTGMSASSHAKSHEDNKTPGWWEKFVGPGCSIDTEKFFVICFNALGGCYGSSGPSSVNPLSDKPYGTHFPMVTIEDIVHSSFMLLDDLQIHQVHASVGSSMGGMTSLMAAALYPDRVGRAICISSCAQTHPSTIAMRYLQRRAIMTDPNWARGHYYGVSYPRMGMKLARELGTVTYRSGAEWLNRFARSTISDEPPSLCPHFEIERYIEHQGEQFSVKYDPNSLLYLSKAMDFFDIGEGFPSLLEGLARVKCPVMVMGAKSDILMPVTQQRQLANLLQESGNDGVTYYELDSIYGHDTFLLDLNNVGAAIKGQLETELKERGVVRKGKPKWLQGQDK